MDDNYGFSNRRIHKKAERIARDDRKANSLAEEVENKAKKHSSEINRFFNEVLTLVRMVKSYANGSYRDFPLKSMVWACFGLIYFLMPMDAIFDAIPGVGYLDDATVIGMVFRAIKNDIDQFRDWEKEG